MSDQPPQSLEDSDEERGRSLRNAATLTAVVGAAHALLFLLSFWLLKDAPGATASDLQIHDYYASGSDRAMALAGLYVMPFAGIAFIWFIVALRMWTTGNVRSENVLLSNVQLVSGIVYLALFFGGAAAMSATVASAQFSDGKIDPDLARQFSDYGGTLLIVFALRMAAMFVFTTSNIGRTAGILPRWFAYTGFVVGAFMLLSASLTAVLALVFPVWLLTLSVILLIKAREIPKDALLPARAGLGMTNPFGAYPQSAEARNDDSHGDSPSSDHRS